MSLVLLAFSHLSLLGSRSFINLIAHFLVARYHATGCVSQRGVCVDGELRRLEDESRLTGLRVHMDCLLGALRVHSHWNVVMRVQLSLILQMTLILQVERLVKVRFHVRGPIGQLSLHRRLHKLLALDGFERFFGDFPVRRGSQIVTPAVVEIVLRLDKQRA